MSILANALVTFYDDRFKTTINLTSPTETWKIEQSPSRAFPAHNEVKNLELFGEGNCGVFNLKNKQTNKIQTSCREITLCKYYLTPLPTIPDFSGMYLGCIRIKIPCCSEEKSEQLFSSCGSQESRKSNTFSPQGRRRSLMSLNHHVNG